MQFFRVVDRWKTPGLACSKAAILLRAVAGREASNLLWFVMPGFHAREMIAGIPKIWVRFTGFYLPNVGPEVEVG
jgi:hypothetical protein